ncbi:MAG: chemotaxis protein CheA [Deltaproteobacteria bacterium]|nr:chemotaxis protein CheA [Deltaproteobacteria bacterium]MBW2019180.1 chemotaxis protein CheA [Deltaproteobacteria bacterium]MBW2073983.1 chemotaxis protein CheA [Deltaproteobacteria bacterium]
MSDQDETLEIFFSETEDLLKSAEESLLALESSPESTSDIEQLFRSVHTVKSGAAMVGFMGISDYAHLLETLLERLRTHKLAVTKNLISFLLSSIDFIRSMVDRVSQGEAEPDPEVLNQRKDQVKRYLGVDGISSPEEVPEPPVKEAPKEPMEEFRFYKIDLKFRKDLFYAGQDPLLILLDLSELGEFVQVVPDLSKLPDFEEFCMYDLYISWQVVIKTTRSYEELEEVFMFVKDDNDIRIEDVTSRYREGVDIELADKKLGELLVERGKITEQELTDALKKQKVLGEILVEDGKIQSEDLEKTVALQEESRAAYRKTTIRVDVEKIDRLVNLGEEMGIGLAKLEALFEKYAGHGQMEIMEELENLVKVNQDFQERVARVRMFPLEGTFRRFQRMARDLAFQKKKQIKVILTGIDTELDKEVIEHITDPLKHLVRNCVDHGIETPEERQAKGKPPTAIIEFKAYQRGGKIFVEIRDDGKGIDLMGIQRKALERGWIEPDQMLSKEDLLSFIFEPGFSTSSKVTELSGRGVGMDVVKTQLDQLGGTIDIHTEKDKGTTFTLCLPLTFALMEVLHVMVQDTSFLLPVQAVVGTERFNKELVKSFGAEERMYPFRGDYIPLIDITKILDIGTPSTNGHSSVLVFLDTGRKAFGIPVDEVLEPKQIIVKTLETNYRTVNGIAGATILGDGSVSLVLDLSGIEEMFFKNGLEGGVAHEGEEKTESV